MGFLTLILMRVVHKSKRDTLSDYQLFLKVRWQAHFKTHSLRMIINIDAIIVLMFELSQNLGQERFNGKRDYCEILIATHQ